MCKGRYNLNKVAEINKTTLMLVIKVVEQKVSSGKWKHGKA